MFELIKIGNPSTNDLENYRSESKTNLNEFYSVQFFLNDGAPSYLFRLRSNSLNKPYILVKQDSSVFKELNVGDILDMEYNQAEIIGNGKHFKTIITSKYPHDNYRGHSIIELSILDN